MEGYTVARMLEMGKLYIPRVLGKRSDQTGSRRLNEDRSGDLNVKEASLVLAEVCGDRLRHADHVVRAKMG